MLIEKYAGAFPLWISPLQVKILSVTDRSIDYAKSLADKLTYAGIRVECDFRSEKIGRKIRDAQLEKIPYMLVLGDREVENGSTVSVRERNGENYEMSTDEFIAKIVFEDKNKVIK